MNKREANKLTMYESVITTLESNAAVYAAVPVITETLNSFKANVDEIKAKDFNFLSATKGETKAKREKEELLIAEILKLANVLYVYGTQRNMPTLTADVKVSRSALSLFRDTELVNRAGQIITYAKEYKDDLTNYGVTEESLTKVEQTLTDFENALSKQQGKFAIRSADREEMTSIYNKTDAILNDQLDPLMELFLEDNSEFYNAYKSARVIKDLGIRHISEQTVQPT